MSSMQIETQAGPVDLSKARMSVVMVGGDRYDDVRLMPGDVVKMERHYEVKVAEGPTSFECTLYMVWMAAKRKGYAGEFEVFLETLEDLGITSGTSTPTPPAP